MYEAREGAWRLFRRLRPVLAASSRRKARSQCLKPAAKPR